MISVVCPFFNEEAILKESLRKMIGILRSLPEPWELIIVNDGSTDGSPQVARSMADECPELRLISYEINRGRGHALLTGMRAARGDPICTTEIDLSWGENMIHKMCEAFQQDPRADIVIASPHVSGGGYKNVPMHRVLLSHYGNYIIRAGTSFQITMNTGMTRGYRRQVIWELPLWEDGKEFHLEVVLKALAFGKRIVEIPALLEWKEHKHNGKAVTRKSSSKIRRIIKSHLVFSAVVAPIRHLWAGAAISLLIAVATGVYAILRYFWDEPYAYAVLGFSGFSLMAIVLFSFGVVAEQNRLLMKELWRIQAQLGPKQSSPLNGESEQTEEFETTA